MTSQSRGLPLQHAPLYVKSFKSWRGEEGSMEEVFSKARELAPCVMVLEDLDSLITDQNRSFFLNQMDGIEGNDGILIIATTNHFDRLDAGLSSRPSRFDRKYKFDDPDKEERTLYCKYWQGKLADNDAVDYPDSLVVEIADTTYGFSFAYLKECFVSSLVLLVAKENKASFSTLVKGQIKELRKQLEKAPTTLSGWGAARVETVGGTTGRANEDRASALPPKPEQWEVGLAAAALAAATNGSPAQTGRTYVY